MTNEQLDQLSINTIRTLSIDAVQQAKSGHPGTPMALAPLVYTIWNRVMRFDPQDPIWPNRDRFVLSNGHASMLLWSVLHLTGTQAVNADYERLGQPSVSLDDIRHFRQLDSKAPGHPEYHWVSGVETTTGPLGQGVATSVGMAIAQKWLAQRYNRPGFDIFDYHIYAVCGDGCLMEGVASEAASLAGHLGLDNLCWVYDNNHITIEGNTRIAFTEDVAARFLGYGWNVLRVGDANDIDRIEHALEVFRQTKGRPPSSSWTATSATVPRTSKTRPRPTASRSARRRSALPSAVYGWPEDAKFLVPDGVREHFAAGVGARGAAARQPWTELFAAYRGKYPELATEIDQMQRRELPAGWDRNLPVFPGRPEGHRRARSLGQGAERAGAEHPLVPGRLGRSRPVEQDHPEIRGGGRLPGRQPGRKEPAFRHSRARDGGDRERAGAVEAAAVRRNLLHLQRLRTARHPSLGPDGIAQPLRLHARRHGRRRRRPDASAGGATAVVARHSRAGHAAARRRQRSRRGLPLHHAVASSAGRARALAPAVAHAGSEQVCAGLRSGARRLCARRRPRREARSDPHRHGQRSQSRRARPTRSLLAEGIRSRVVSMPSWDIFEHQTRGVPRERAAARESRPASPWSRPRHWDGSATSARRAASSA